ASLVEDTTVDPDASLSITITGVPSDATLNHGSFYSGTNTWTLTPGDLSGLTITPGSSTDAFTLTVDAKTTDGTATADTIKTLDVSVTPVADAPNLTVAAASGNEDTPIALNISASLVEDTTVDPDASLSITITGVPSDATLNHGSFDSGTNTWTLTPGDLSGLTITPGSSTDAFTLTVDAKTTDGTATADTIKTLDVSVTPVADAPNLTVAAASGNEDTPIALNISASLVEDTTVDPDASLSITITGVPSDATLNHGSFDSGTNTWTLTPGDLSGLTITPGSSTDAFTLTVDAKTTDGTATADTIKTLDVSVTPVADAPNLTVAAASGNEDTPIALNISASLVEDTTVDPDASLSITITGVPSDATLNHGSFDSGTNTWTLTPGDLSGLTITPGSSTDAFTLTVDA